MRLEGKVRFGEKREGGRRASPKSRRLLDIELLEAEPGAVSGETGICI